MPKQFSEYVNSFSEGSFVEFCNGRVSPETRVAIWELEWEGISQRIVIVVRFCIGSGSGGKFGLPFPILVFHDELAKCFLVFESTVCGGWQRIIRKHNGNVYLVLDF